MANIKTAGAMALAALSIYAYQTYIKDILYVSGITRSTQLISEFPYQCQSIKEPVIQACEDMWFDEDTRELYLACSSAYHRADWLPNMGKLNATGRHTKDSIVVMNIDKPNGRGFEYRVIEPVGFTGELHALTVEGYKKPGSSAIELWLVNNKPSMDMVNGKLVDNTKTGANTTIEIFEIEPSSSKMSHVRTFFDPLIVTPNNVAVTKSGDFYITNDHGLVKTGIRHKVSPFLYSGNVVYCSVSPKLSCKIVATGHAFPNEPVINPLYPDLLFIPSSGTEGAISVYKIQDNGDLELVDKIPVPCPIDNMTVDKNGDIIAAGIPKPLVNLQAFENIRKNMVPPSNVLKISRNSITSPEEQSYTVEKIIEDGDAEILPSATTVVHDAKTGRLFISGILSYDIAVCEPK